MAQEPDYQSFPLVSNEDVHLEFTVRDNGGNVLDLTGGSGRFAMARERYSTTRVVDSDASPATASIVLVDAANGRVDARIDRAQMDELRGDYYYAMKWTDSLSRETLVAHGIASVGQNLI